MITCSGTRLWLKGAKSMGAPDLSVTQVAFFFFRKLKQHSVSKMKIQALCYFAQGWWAAKTGDKLFTEDFEARKHGPVSPTLQSIGTHDKQGFVREDFDGVLMSGFSEEEERFLNLLLSRYGLCTGLQLSEKIRGTAPHADARASGVNTVIPVEWMIAYYARFLRK